MGSIISQETLDRFNPVKQVEAIRDIFRDDGQTRSVLQDPFGLRGAATGFIERNPQYDIGARVGTPLKGILRGTTPTTSAQAGTAGDTGFGQLLDQTTDTSAAVRGDGGIPIGLEGDFITGGTEGDRSADQIRQAELQRQAYIDQANKWADDLIAEAQGDRDFAIRQLDAEHKVALGQGDTERAAFLESVSDALEERIGTIPYDYERGISRLEQNKSRALERLASDEKELRRQFGTETEAVRREQAESLSQRGLLTGTREETVGLGAKGVGELEKEIAARFATLERSILEPRQDITRTATREREDITKQARRAGLATERTFEFGKEAQERAFESQRRQLERERKQEIDFARRAQFEGIVT